MKPPEGVKMEVFGSDIVIVGPGMTKELYESIKAGLSPEERGRVMGWRSIGKNRVNGQ